jgi:drug/metabolite transporter (DMT)-like permease
MATVAVTSFPGSSTARGIGLAVLSYVSFSTADALIKVASGGFSVFQIAATMAVFALVPVLLLARGQGGLRALVPQGPGLVALRGALTAGGGLCAWQAFSRLPLADGYAILFGAPMLVTALSALILRESVGWRRWSAAVVGFMGVLVMVRPDFATLSLGHALAALAAVQGALSFIVLKKIGAREKSSTILFAVFLAIFLASAPFAVQQFRMPSLHELSLMALAGLLMGAGQAGLVLATREAPAVVVAPFQYTQMLWAVVFGLALFGDEPAPRLFLGMAIVVGSGLYIIWREAVRRQTVTIGAARGEVPARAAR